MQHNLPLQMTSFIGREREVAELTQLLSGARQPTMPGIQAMIDFLAESSPNIKGHKPAEFVDLRLLKDLPK